MGLEGGISPGALLRWAYLQMSVDPRLQYIVYDEAMEQLYFTVRAPRGIERRYRLTIEQGTPRVVQVEGPPEDPRTDRRPR